MFDVQFRQKDVEDLPTDLISFAFDVRRAIPTQGLIFRRERRRIRTSRANERGRLRSGDDDDAGDVMTTPSPIQRDVLGRGAGREEKEYIQEYWEWDSPFLNHDAVANVVKFGEKMLWKPWLKRLAAAGLFLAWPGRLAEPSRAAAALLTAPFLPRRESNPRPISVPVHQMEEEVSELIEQCTVYVTEVSKINLDGEHSITGAAWFSDDDLRNRAL
ncbi:hypothetical protein B0H17DRAFT_1152156 [Mycena rosella]|uniref:Uncharacterized protein n=1 Tax=Mycena rosella TaxID=1033263 RepID=A0AAD7BF06_MYCRO|nr:hypothetical protein B0H17DRAFT_1152156 [Mycena rosella]